MVKVRPCWIASTSVKKSQVVYWNLLRERLLAINDEINERNVGCLITSLRRDLDHAELMAGNGTFTASCAAERSSTPGAATALRSRSTRA